MGAPTNDLSPERIIDLLGLEPLPDEVASSPSSAPVVELSEPQPEVRGSASAVARKKPRVERDRSTATTVG